MLERIYISDNQIDELPHELGKLSKLIILDVHNNKITLIPPDIADIETLKKIDISLNPVIPSIDQVARQGLDKLLRYLKSDDYDETYYM